jgi:hypothetical protein
VSDRPTPQASLVRCMISAISIESFKHRLENVKGCLQLLRQRDGIKAHGAFPSGVINEQSKHEGPLRITVRFAMFPHVHTNIRQG